MEDFLLSFEFEDEKETLIIHGDELGLINLCNVINKLLTNTKEGYFNHDHLMTPNWGGYELSEKNMGNKVINHVKLCCWKGEEFQR